MEKTQLRKELQQGVEFVGNAEAKCGVLTAVRDEFVTRRETTGKSEEVYFVKRLQSSAAKRVGRHKLLYMPNSPKPLLGHDLLNHLPTEIKFKGK